MLKDKEQPGLPLSGRGNEGEAITKSTSFGLASKVKDYFQLIKFTLSFMVVFSTVVSFLIGYNEQEFIYQE